jgi:transcription termination factor Rho
VTETIDSAAPTTKSSSGGGLSNMLLADLKRLAASLNIKGTSTMKKADLITAINGARSAGAPSSNEPKAVVTQRSRRGRDQANGVVEQPTQGNQTDPQAAVDESSERTTAAEPGHSAAETAGAPGAEQTKPATGDNEETADRNRDRRDRSGERGTDRSSDRSTDRSTDRGDRNGDRGGDRGGDRSSDRGDRNDRYDDGNRRGRRRRGRDRRDRNDRGSRGEPDIQIHEDDVLVPAAGILDVLDNYAFVRTSGYLPGAEDVYLSLSMVRKYGLRRGDAVVGQVRQPREGERREKFNPMVRIDSVNSADPEQSKERVEFSKLTPLYPNERLRLETEPSNLIGRVIDIAAPIGKGQRGLIVSPAKAGKTMIMQSIANSITTNNPECHLMVVLVDERPEEVTDFERSVKGEVISSTFDRPASDHTTVAELAIERAKRLVELGLDVVVLLDGITRLGRAYNLAAPASGRILSGGVDSAALYPPKRFFGAARNIEDGGSLTILATALIESGSKMDEVIFEEFKGTGNMEIRLRRDFADKRLFPAIDAVQSGTRREELLMSKDELAIVWKLRRVLSALDGQQALELLLERLKKTNSNVEFLMQVQKTTPGSDGDD